MRVELINTGTELLIGRVLNTHQYWLGAQMVAQGWPITHQCTVPDTGTDIERALRAALRDGGLIITTGGIGPTSDDLTRQHLASLLQRPLREDPAVAQQITDHFVRRNRPMPPSVMVQALVPDGATVLPNAHGTAPGLALTIAAQPSENIAASWLVMLPGPPRELRPMFTTQVLPWLRDNLPPLPPLASRTLRMTGIGESRVEAAIVPALGELIRAGLEIGYCAHCAGVDVRLSARGAEAATIVQRAEEHVRRQLSAHIYGTDEETLEEIIVRQLTQRGQTLAVAESCTGGLLAHRITNVPGASAMFVAGATTYSNAAKETVLGVRSQTLMEHGAVSEAVAREMAAGVRARHHTDFALATTGIAGPGGGSATKPVGTVFIALATAAGVQVRQEHNAFDRATFKEVTSQQALEMLRVHLGSGALENSGGD